MNAIQKNTASELAHIVESIRQLESSPELTLDILQRIGTLRNCLEIVAVATFGDRRVSK